MTTAPMPAPPATKTIKPILGGIFFLLAMLKNLVLVAAASMIGGTLTATSIGTLFTIMPLVGLVGCLGAMVMCFMRKMWMITLVLGILALVGSSLFGIMGYIAPLGLVFSLLGVVMVVLSKNEFQG